MSALCQKMHDLSIRPSSRRSSSGAEVKIDGDACSIMKESYIMGVLVEAKGHMKAVLRGRFVSKEFRSETRLLPNVCTAAKRRAVLIAFHFKLKVWSD